MGIFTRRLGAKDHIANIDCRMYLYDLRKKILNGDYAQLTTLADSFQGEIPKEKCPLRTYQNYCALRKVSNEFGGIEKAVAVFKKTTEGDEKARRVSLQIIDSLEEYLQAKAA